MKTYSIQEINTILNGEVVGNTSQKVSGPEELQKATIDQISFIGSQKYSHLWKTSKASIAIVNDNLTVEPEENRSID